MAHSESMKISDTKHIPARSGLPSYTLIRSERRSMQIQIEPYTGEILLRIPRRTSQRTAEDFLRRNLSDVLSSVSRAKSMKPGGMECVLDDNTVKKLKEQAAAFIPERVRYWSEQLGLTMPDKISYTSAQKRFGSCRKYPDGRVHLCFSYRLMQFPKDAVDAVVLHEVAHMRHMDHSTAFYALIRSVMPDYDSRHSKLKETENMP